MYETLAIFADGKYLGSETVTGEGSFDHAEAAVRAFNRAMEVMAPRPNAHLYHLRYDWGAMTDEQDKAECEKAWADYDD